MDPGVSAEAACSVDTATSLQVLVCQTAKSAPATISLHGGQMFMPVIVWSMSAGPGRCRKPNALAQRGLFCAAQNHTEPTLPRLHTPHMLTVFGSPYTTTGRPDLPAGRERMASAVPQIHPHTKPALSLHSKSQFPSASVHERLLWHTYTVTCHGCNQLTASLHHVPCQMESSRSNGTAQLALQ